MSTKSCDCDTILLDQLKHVKLLRKKYTNLIEEVFLFSSNRRYNYNKNQQVGALLSQLRSNHFFDYLSSKFSCGQNYGDILRDIYKKNCELNFLTSDLKEKQNSITPFETLLQKDKPEQNSSDVSCRKFIINQRGYTKNQNLHRNINFTNDCENRKRSEIRPKNLKHKLQRTGVNKMLPYKVYSDRMTLFFPEEVCRFYSFILPEKNVELDRDVLVQASFVSNRSNRKEALIDGEENYIANTGKWCENDKIFEPNSVSSTIALALIEDMCPISSMIKNKQKKPNENENINFDRKLEDQTEHKSAMKHYETIKPRRTIQATFSSQNFAENEPSISYFKMEKLKQAFSSQDDMLKDEQFFINYWNFDNKKTEELLESKVRVDKFKGKKEQSCKTVDKTLCEVKSNKNKITNKLRYKKINYPMRTKEIKQVNEKKNTLKTKDSRIKHNFKKGSSIEMIKNNNSKVTKDDEKNGDKYEFKTPRDIKHKKNEEIINILQREHKTKFNEEMIEFKTENQILPQNKMSNENVIRNSQNHENETSLNLERENSDIKKLCEFDCFRLRNNLYNYFPVRNENEIFDQNFNYNTPLKNYLFKSCTAVEPIEQPKQTKNLKNNQNYISKPSIQKCYSDIPLTKVYAKNTKGGLELTGDKMGFEKYKIVQNRGDEKSVNEQLECSPENIRISMEKKLIEQFEILDSKYSNKKEANNDYEKNEDRSKLCTETNLGIHNDRLSFMEASLKKMLMKLGEEVCELFVITNGYRNFISDQQKEIIRSRNIQNSETKKNKRINEEEENAIREISEIKKNLNSNRVKTINENSNKEKQICYEGNSDNEYYDHKNEDDKNDLEDNEDNEIFRENVQDKNENRFHYRGKQKRKHLKKCVRFNKYDKHKHPNSRQESESETSELEDNNSEIYNKGFRKLGNSSTVIGKRNKHKEEFREKETKSLPTFYSRDNFSAESQDAYVVQKDVEDKEINLKSKKGYSNETCVSFDQEEKYLKNNNYREEEIISGGGANNKNRKYKTRNKSNNYNSKIKIKEHLKTNQNNLSTDKNTKSKAFINKQSKNQNFYNSSNYKSILNTKNKNSFNCRRSSSSMLIKEDKSIEPEDSKTNYLSPCNSIDLEFKMRVKTQKKNLDGTHKFKNMKIEKIIKQNDQDYKSNHIPYNIDLKYSDMTEDGKLNVILCDREFKNIKPDLLSKMKWTKVQAKKFNTKQNSKTSWENVKSNNTPKIKSNNSVFENRKDKELSYSSASQNEEKTSTCPTCKRDLSFNEQISSIQNISDESKNESKLVQIICNQQSLLKQKHALPNYQKVLESKRNDDDIKNLTKNHCGRFIENQKKQNTINLCNRNKTSLKRTKGNIEIILGNYKQENTHLPSNILRKPTNLGNMFTHSLKSILPESLMGNKRSKKINKTISSLKNKRKYKLAEVVETEKNNKNVTILGKQHSWKQLENSNKLISEETSLVDLGTGKIIQWKDETQFKEADKGENIKYENETICNKNISGHWIQTEPFQKNETTKERILKGRVPSGEYLKYCLNLIKQFNRNYQHVNYTTLDENPKMLLLNNINVNSKNFNKSDKTKISYPSPYISPQNKSIFQINKHRNKKSNELNNEKKQNVMVQTSNLNVTHTITGYKAINESSTSTDKLHENKKCDSPICERESLKDKDKKEYVTNIIVAELRGVGSAQQDETGDENNKKIGSTQTESAFQETLPNLRGAKRQTLTKKGKKPVWKY